MNTGDSGEGVIPSVRRAAFLVLLVATALGGCTARGRAAPEAPAAAPDARSDAPSDAPSDAVDIVDWPISFSDERKEMTLTYIREHYGLTPPDLRITPRMVVLHWTAIETLEASFRAFDREVLVGRPDIAGAGDVNVSIHFLVDRGGTIYRLMPETWMARHVIGLNYDAIGVENVGTGGEEWDTLTGEQVAANIRLVRYLAGKYPTIEYLIGHHEYQAFEGHPLWRELDAGYRTAKIDPGERFMDAVRAGVGALGLKGAVRLGR